MNPIQKRNNPFEKKIKPEAEKPVEELVEEEQEEEFEEIFEEKPAQPVKKVVQTPKKVVVEQEFDNNRVKYTSTMDKKLRRQIKIVCAERGLLFAAFIEEACKEKLRREREL